MSTADIDPLLFAGLAHPWFVAIHPFENGNGRMGRFLMNAMMAAGGYPWTVIPVEHRGTYMSVLEQTSVHGVIVPFSDLRARLVDDDMKEWPFGR